MTVEVVVSLPASQEWWESENWLPSSCSSFFDLAFSFLLFSLT